MLIKTTITDAYEKIHSIFNKFPFIIIIGKYDHTLGPRAIYSSVNLEIEPEFLRDLLRDALNTKSKSVILNFNYFYSQIYKIQIEDNNARGKRQLYSIIMLRDIEYPIIPLIHFRKIEMMFRKIGEDNILSDNKRIFEAFFKKLSDTYIKKNEILPLEKFNLQIRSGVNTIQGFCELILEDKKDGNNLSENNITNFIEMMLDSCKDIIISLEKYLNSSLK
jgi:hypothetical protein